MLYTKTGAGTLTKILKAPGPFFLKTEFSKCVIASRFACEGKFSMDRMCVISHKVKMTMHMYTEQECHTVSGISGANTSTIVNENFR